MPRCIGKLDKWDPFFELQCKNGYNAFHLAPIQELGVSNSQYCIKDHNKLSSEIIDGNLPYDKQQEQLKNTVDNIKVKYNGLMFVDIVLNHCAKNADWILKEPSCYYSTSNTPSLEAAYVVDKAIYDFRLTQATNKRWLFDKCEITNEEQLMVLMKLLKEDVLEPLKIEDYYRFDVEKVVSAFQEEFNKRHNMSLENDASEKHTPEFNIFKTSPVAAIKKLVQDNIRNYGAGRFALSFDFDGLLDKFVAKEQGYTINTLKRSLEVLNQENIKKAQGWVNDAQEAISGTVRYQKLECGKHQIGKDNVIVERYFDELANGDVVALNGWIFGEWDPLEDFVTSSNMFYLRRQIVIWGDQVKLRYKSKEECPLLWKYMSDYVVSMARLFDGFRLDNFHNTPLNVAEELLRLGREANPNIFIFAELFTNSAERDSIYCKRSGCHAMIRESQHGGGSLKNLSDSLLYFTWRSKTNIGSLLPYKTDDMINYNYINPELPESIFYDQSHDNKSFHTTGRLFHTLPIAAILSFSQTNSGSTYGFDQFYPEQLSVVTENRIYENRYTQEVVLNVMERNVTFCVNVSQFNMKDEDVHTVGLMGSWNSWEQRSDLEKNENGWWSVTHKQPVGEHQYKYVINNNIWVNNPCTELQQDKSDVYNNAITVENGQKLHNNLTNIKKVFNNFHELLQRDYKYSYTSVKKDDIVTITREGEDSLSSYMLITKCASNGNDSKSITIDLPGRLVKVHHVYHFLGHYDLDKPIDGGFEQIVANIIESNDLLSFGTAFYSHETNNDYIHFSNQPASFACIIETEQVPEQLECLTQIKTITNISAKSLAEKFYDQLDAVDINYQLYTCNTEEQAYFQSSCYDLPDYGLLKYAGFAGIKNFLMQMDNDNNLGHPLCDNLRNGNWLIDYYINRIERKPHAHNLTIWIKKAFKLLKQVPRYLIPRYFHQIMSLLISSIETTYLMKFKKQNVFITNDFFRALILATPQFLSKNPFHIGEPALQSAGLPHFTTGCWKAWGRDTFISMKGLLIIPGMVKEAREIILYFATLMRHGLIPNLIDPPRYNSRDATMWYIKAIKDYIEETQDWDILKVKVEMRFLSSSREKHDDLTKKNMIREQTLVDVLQEILERHANGIKFIEWDHKQIDEHMTYEGHNIDLWPDWTTGFVLGGNKYNCLTWMDKMGSSEKSGNKGIPASSRDGAPIDMTALLYLAVNFMKTLYDLEYSPHNQVEILQKKKTITYAHWVTT